MQNKHTIYECWQNNKLAECVNTEQGALHWLSENGGGVYKNKLHNFTLNVKPDEYKNLI